MIAERRYTGRLRRTTGARLERFDLAPLLRNGIRIKKIILLFMEPCGTDNTNVEGNTKPPRKYEKKHRTFFCTWNNYPETWEISIDNLYKHGLVWGQQEQGPEGTPHLQFCFALPNPRSWESVKTWIWGLFKENIHIEPCKDIRASKVYCTDEKKRYGKWFTNDKTFKVIKLFPVKRTEKKKFEPLPWQAETIESLKLEPIARTVNWIVDKEGCSGKTTLGLELSNEYDNIQYIPSGKSSDIKHHLNKIITIENKQVDVIFINFPKSLDDPKFVSYDLMEQISDGCIFSGKYEGGVIKLPPPHLYIFANFEPVKDKLINDRWNIKYLNNGKLRNNRHHIIDDDE